MSEVIASKVKRPRNQLGRIRSRGLIVSTSTSATNNAPCVMSCATLCGIGMIAPEAGSSTLKKSKAQMIPTRRGDDVARGAWRSMLTSGAVCTSPLPRRLRRSHPHQPTVDRTEGTGAVVLGVCVQEDDGSEGD